MTDSAAMDKETSLVDDWYAEGPKDRPFDPTDKAFGVYVIVADDSDMPGCVTVENPAGQRFALDRSLAADMALSPPPCADHPDLRPLRRESAVDDALTQCATDLLIAAEGVMDAWDGGDLAEAVRALAFEAEALRALLPDTPPADAETVPS